MFHLTFPTISHKSRYLEMIEEWRNFESIPTSPRALFHGETFEEFLDIATKYKTANPNGINSTLFFFMEDAEILWALQLRHHINHPNCSLEWKCGGHIGYGLRPSARGKWLAKVMLSLGLEEARKMDIEKVLISAHADNIASWKTIEWLDGEFIKEIDDDGKRLKVYWINNP
jgi:predicted acetyltransferase